MGIYVIIIIIALVVQILISIKFANIAEEKGYEGFNYGLLCFFFSVVGYCMVAALPDLRLQSTINEIYRKVDRLAAPNVQPAAAPPAVDKKNEVTVKNTSASTEAKAPNFAENGDIICPSCGMQQAGNRRVCWKCGQKFNVE